MITVVLLPLEDHIPPVAGFSILFIIFGLLAGYVLLFRARILIITYSHPVFLTGYTLLLWGLLIESLHPDSSYSELVRIGEMVAGAVIIASLCRDKQALRASIYGYVAASVWLAALLFLTSYGTLQVATASEYHGASRVRDEALSNVPIETNLNTMAFYTAQGAVVALALALRTRPPLKRNLILGVTMLCLVASFLPMSRSGIVIALVSCTTVLCTYRAKRIRVIIMAAGLVAGILTLVPDVVFLRMAFLADDGRTRVYTAALKHLPEYLPIGVGAGNFWGTWGRDSGFGVGLSVHGAHNTAFQVTIYWGLVALLALITMAWHAYRCLPKRCGDDALALSLRGIAVCLLLWLLCSHTLYDKQFSLGLGLLVGARRWVWPKGIILSAPALRPVAKWSRKKSTKNFKEMPFIGAVT